MLINMLKHLQGMQIDRPNETPNIFPGNWDVVTQELLKTYEAWFKQNWGPVELPWDELNRENFDQDQAVAQAYWMAKLALFEKSGIGAFSLATLQAARYNMEDPTKKFLAGVTYDECRHDEICRRACNRLCPGFPYKFKPKTTLEEKALRNIQVLYDNGKRYWSAFEKVWEKYPLELIFSSFFFAEIGAQLIFKTVAEKSRLSVYTQAFNNITKDESRHLAGTLALLDKLAREMPKEHKLMITRQMKHGFIYLSPLLFKPMPEFWKLPDDFLEWDQRLEEKAYEAGLGVPTAEEKAERWYKAIEQHRKKLESLEVPVPAIKEVGVDGVDVPVKKGDNIVATPL